MNSFASELRQRLDAIQAQGLHRVLRRIDSAQSRLIRFNDQEFLNFSSNDYLGLADHPRLKTAALEATARYGTGSGASRLICGSLAPHHELETALAEFKGTGGALSFASGYAAALGTIGALVGKEDIIVLDKLVHASLVDAARLSGAKLRVFPHNDLAALEEILKWAADRPTGSESRGSQVLIVTESIFSMDGDAAPMAELVALKERFGAWLMVDEAHATGVFGDHRRGVAEAAGVTGRIEIQLGTLGKALGSAGGYICGAPELIDYLINRARSFIFSTAPPPAAAAAAHAAVDLVRSPEGAERAAQLWANIAEVRAMLGAAGWPVPEFSSPIVPLVIGDETAAVAAATHLRERGIFIPAIRYPTVARGSARLRLTLSAAHTREDLERLAGALVEIRPTLPLS